VIHFANMYKVLEAYRFSNKALEFLEIQLLVVLTFNGCHSGMVRMICILACVIHKKQMHIMNECEIQFHQFTYPI
jgi:hypothetical protein